VLTPDQLARDLAIRDLTDPTEGPHALQLLIDDAVAALDVPAVRECRGPRIVDRTDNYDALGFPPESVTRDVRYTRYIDADRMLRSHSSAMMPPGLRGLDASLDDVLLVAPGIVFRRDSIDRLHTGTPHQLDLWRIARRPMTGADMDDMVERLVHALAPGRQHRSEASAHPYTVDGRQVDVRAGDEWVEVWECGVAHPDVLARAGLDGWSGLALGMGLDRLLMLRKGIPDIRLLRATDPRIASQMLDLSPYNPVSDLPAVVRDLSIAVPNDDDAELLGDRARDALGTDADLIESIEVVAETGWLQLPDAAVRRLGMDASQKNVLVRLVLRPFDRTLTDAEANALRDRVYVALHRGKVMTLATSLAREQAGERSHPAPAHRAP
jgi:phenylalanyl-tRNA synthetase alpha chain